MKSTEIKKVGQNMKGKFFAPVGLMQIEDAMRKKLPYAVLVVSTTGLDNTECITHSPTRVVLSMYDYDNQTGVYKECFTFDKLVKADETAIKYAIDKQDEYDVFSNAGINKDSYLKGENVLSIKEFASEFSIAMNAIEESNALLIANNTAHSIHYLEKIDCGQKLKEFSEKGSVLDQTRLTNEYLQKHSITNSANLENLRNAIIPLPKSYSFLRNEYTLKSYKNLSKEDFLNKFPEVNGDVYDGSKKWADKMSEKIIGGDKQISVINKFIEKFGREQYILVSAITACLRQSEQEYSEELSKKGKNEYEGKSVKEKIETLKEMGAVNQDEIAKGNSAYHSLMNAVNNGTNKGIVVFHVATTGFEKFKKAPQVTGQPIAFAARIYLRGEDGKVDMSQMPRGKNCLIEAPSKAILAAENEANKPNGYDTFKEAGIDINDYKAGTNVLSHAAAIKTISDFFNKVPSEDFTYVVIGGAGKNYPDSSFAQTALQNLGNFPACKAPYIDFCQAVKDYSVLVESGLIDKNVLFENNKLSKFGIKDLANAVGIDAEKVASCGNKCGFVARAVSHLVRQQEEKNAQIDKNIDSKETVQNSIRDNTEEPSNKKEPYIEFLDKVKINTEEEKIKKATLSNAFREIAIESGVFSNNGNLYSDRHNDSLPVAEVEKIKVIGKEKIPHVSEAHESTSFDNSPFGRKEEEPSEKDEFFEAIKKQNQTTQDLIAAVASFTEIVNKQQEQISILQAANLKMQELLFTTMNEHNAFLIELANEKNSTKQSKDVLSFLEEQKENIDTVRNSLPSGSKARSDLSSANKAISNAQKNIEEKGKEEINKIS